MVLNNAVAPVVVAWALTFACKPSAETAKTLPAESLAAQASNASAAVLCDASSWKTFPTVEAALADVLANKPRVLAVGETHARRGAPDVLTATERFGNSLLPLAAAQGAKVLVVELLSPPSGCETETKAVAQAQKPVIEQQDEQNQDRFIALGHRARELQVTPLVLEPTCDEFATVRKAGPDGVAAMLQLIADHTREKVERLLTKTGPNDLIVAYGGALHNNLGTDAPFAFGEQLKQRTQERYVALDLIVPEYVADTDAWKKLPWYPCWPELAGRGVTLVQTAPGEFTLFMEPALARSSVSATPGVASSGGTSGVLPAQGR